MAGFANASGGKIYIGLDDKGKAVGLNNAHKLMEDIPNKIVSYLGIIADVNLLSADNKHYIEINITPSGVPISYKGVYHYRSGSTKQELKGSALQQFILKRIGRTWDDLPCENATFSDIDPDALSYFFKKAANSNRLTTDIEKSDLKTAFENLNLLTNGNKLKNAALLLFGKKPSKFFPSVSFKIGRFITGDDDLRYQDIVEGNILQMADKVMDILKTKYLISPISYEGLQRIEKLEVPEMALREVIFNAIIHKDYTGAPIQLSVYNDKLMLWNEGRLPEDFTIETLLGKHPSRPFNKNIADIFFKAGFIEAWGRGIAKITNGFKNEGLKVPAFETTMGGIMVTIERPGNGKKSNNNKNVTDKVVDNSPDRVTNRVTDRVTDNQKKIVALIEDNNKISTSQIAENIGISKRKVLDNINKLKNRGLIQRIGSPKGGHWKIINQ
ncbi:MAG: ATP-binding protein [Salinivirgaceae bacterium]